MIFQKWGGVQGCLDFFQKFIWFGSGIHPLDEDTDIYRLNEFICQFENYIKKVYILAKISRMPVTDGHKMYLNTFNKISTL